mmetsp:Transcript_64400/g.194319  ORF Transcript_64400/g.194319 Transcript_64400/m.194319 type:complete len:227 (-) Transcript_64400:18-698(-)
MRRIRALEDRGELGVAHARLLARGADAAGADADLDDVRAAEDELLRHLLGDDVAGHDGDRGPAPAHVPDALHESLCVAIGHVDADHPEIRHGLQDPSELVDILGEDARAHSHVRQHCSAGPGSPGSPLLDAVVLVHRGDALPLGQGLGDLERADGVHVGGDDGHACPLLLGILEGEAPLDAHLRPTGQAGTLWPDEHILEVKLRFVLHDRHGGWHCEARRHCGIVP